MTASRSPSNRSLAALFFTSVLAFPANAQDGVEAGSIAHIEQIGDNSTSHVVHRGGAGNRTQITTEGDRNVARIGVFGRDNGADRANRIEQSGSGNISNAGIIGQNNSLTIRQTMATGAGTGQPGNAAFALISGSDNSALIVQDNAIGDGIANEVRIAQIGSGNTASARQTASVEGAMYATADGNRSLILQRGNDNVAETDQRGTNNTVAILQDNDDNQGYVTQTGQGNSLRLLQDGGDYYKIKQSGCVNPSGCAPVTVNQWGGP